jgi:hypothetical protein
LAGTCLTPCEPLPSAIQERWRWGC